MVIDDYNVVLRIYNEACDSEDSGDLEKAIILYEKAAKLGMSSACINLANILHARNLSNDRDSAVHFYKMGAKLQNPDAAKNLSILYKMEIKSDGVIIGITRLKR